MFYKLLKNNAYFLFPYLIVALVLLPLFIGHSKPELHLIINRHNAPVADWFFRNITYIGDGIFVMVITVLFLFFSLRHAAYLLTTYLATGLLVQVLKRIFFSDLVRPAAYFQHLAPLHVVDGVELLGSRTFPSGHAATAFALFLSLALVSKNRYVKLACFLLASLTAFSRVYLSQHFLIDVYAGSIIGCAGALVFHLVFYKETRKWHTWNLQKLFRHDCES